MRKLIQKIMTPEMLTDNTAFYLVAASFKAAPQAPDDEPATLILTRNGNWILDSPLSKRLRNSGLPEYIDADAAVFWLRTNGHEEAAKHYARNPVGRPAIGPKVETRLGDLLPRVEAYAKTYGTSRSEAIRQLVALGLEQKEV